MNGEHFPLPLPPSLWLEVDMIARPAAPTWDYRWHEDKSHSLRIAEQKHGGSLHPWWFWGAVLEHFSLLLDETNVLKSLLLVILLFVSELTLMDSIGNYRLVFQIRNGVHPSGAHLLSPQFPSLGNCPFPPIHVPPVSPWSAGWSLLVWGVLMQAWPAKGLP